MNKDEQAQFIEGLKSKQTVKRQKIGEEGFEKSEHYVINGKDENAENLWKKDEKFNMEDLNLNLIPDDENSLMKKKTQMKWDHKKKRYVQVQVGKDGKAQKLKNEAGKFINYKKDKDPELYKKWMKKTHLKIQETGELEDKHTVDSANTFHRNKYEMKKSGHKANRVKEREQLRKLDQIEKMKKKKLKLKEMKMGRKRDPNSASSVKFHKRIQAKIEARSRPTKNKIIMKERKRR